MHSLTLLFSLLTLISMTTSNNSQSCSTTSSDTSTCTETTSETSTSASESIDSTLQIIPPAEAHNNELGVIFENQSGRKVNLYWDDGADGILQSTLNHADSVTINTYIGHKFYYTDFNDKNNILYKTIMSEHIGNIVLYNEQEMSERDMKFEREKQEFYREYFEKTGKRWLNYYPRKPVKHFYWNFTNIGDIIKVKSGQTFFNKCNFEDINDEVGLRLIHEENEWFDNNNVHDINQIHPFNESDREAKTGEYANVGGTNPLPSYSEITDKYHIVRWNKTFYCRELTNNDIKDDIDNDEMTTVNDIEFEIEVLCTEPQVATIANFVSDAEIDAIKNAGLYNGLKRSTVTEEAVVTQDRTSATVWIDRSDSLIIDNVIRRIADVVKIPQHKLHLNMSSESLQLVHYFRGELYKAHHDYGTDRPHNRYITFLIYLNDVEQGGYTSFPQASEKCKKNGYFGVKPEKGRVAWFYDLLSDGNVDPMSLHYAEPPINCEKWMSNLWIWDEYFMR